ncbi:carboxylesterase family protein [Robiginitalea sp. M366]|uniref:carboxylesterase/lipase family protein n=1 Tax=Robiginitalea aestuariiviva TaxID=3036903 RepID=UPI00240E8F01|nr:carboxylesterase family protein [Robiginitalea aestuariiviva]MDG1572678.1 carboxylesterase family protein [Robiginitalea aestuariiviva]
MNRFNRIAALMMFFAATGLLAQNPNAFPVQVMTGKGLIEGQYDTHTGIQTYFGVPFAKPPVGERRWKAPEPMDAWSGVKAAKAFGPRPMQTMVFGDMKSRSQGVSEDCLYLNVWSPATRENQNLPVLLYFYGGGNVAGDASEYRYDGESMAKKGIVVVTANYRLNVFGYLAHPELSAETPYGGSGNYGAMDQVAALQWVRDNIAAFGGNPEQITIAGESAGSIGVSTLMASPLSREMLAGAIGESGASINPTMAPVPLEEAEAQGKAFLDGAGIPSISALRKLPTRDIYEIYNASRRFGFPLVVDGHFLPATLPEIFGKGQQAQVPLLLGWNSAEIPGMAFMQGQPYTPEAFKAKVKETYPKRHTEVLALYPHANAREVELSATALASDRFIVYSTWKWFDLHRKNSDQPVYRYLYSKLRPPLKDANLRPGLAGGTVEASGDAPPPPQAVGAPHACEIEYCMGNLHLVDDYAWTPEDFKVSETMQAYFAAFIRGGNPNAEGLPQWDAAGAKDKTPPVMVIDTESRQVQAPADARFTFHDRVYQD